MEDELEEWRWIGQLRRDSCGIRRGARTRFPRQGRSHPALQSCDVEGLHGRRRIIHTGEAL